MVCAVGEWRGGWCRPRVISTTRGDIDHHTRRGQATVPVRAAIDEPRPTSREREASGPRELPFCGLAHNSRVRVAPSFGVACVRFPSYHLRMMRPLDECAPRTPPGASSVFLSLDDAALLAQCGVDCFRSSGPGGQKRNKTSSAVRLRHQPTGLAVTAVEDRSQHVNKARALRRLRHAIALHVRSTLDRATYRPSELLASCIAGGGVEVGRRDRRYDLVVAEVLDVFALCDARVADAAERIGVSTANLVKFLGGDPKLWERVNQMRAAAGVKPLRS